MFDHHLPAKWRDEAPKILHTDSGDDVWTFNGSIIPNIGLNAVAGRPKEEYGIEPTSFDEGGVARCGAAARLRRR